MNLSYLFIHCVFQNLQVLKSLSAKKSLHISAKGFNLNIYIEMNDED